MEIGGNPQTAFKIKTIMRAKRLEESSFDDEDDVSLRVVDIEIGIRMFKLRLRISHCRFAIEESYHGISLET